jgi:hypothetical protein
MLTTKAKVTVKNAKGEVIATQEYDKVVFEGLTMTSDGKPTLGDSPEAVSTALGAAIEFYQKASPKGNGVVDLLKDATYAYDLGVRANIRQSLVTAIAGPDKAIEKMVKDMIAARAAAGKPITEEAARAKVALIMGE